MYPLDEFVRENHDRWSSGKPIRFALVSRSYRSVDRERGVKKQVFGSRFPPLGLLNIGAILRADQALLRRLTEVRLFDEEDCEGVDDLFELINSWLEDWDGPTMIGATCYTATLPELSRFLTRFEASQHLLVVGGPHIAVQPNFETAHIAVRGEARLPIRHIVNTFATDLFFEQSSTDGIVYQRDEASSPVPARTSFDDSLETIPSPAFDYSLSSSALDTFVTHVERSVSLHPQIYVCTQSCRARCSFCSTYLIHGKSKSRPVDLIRQDLYELVHHYGHDGFEFWDDDLLQHKEIDELLKLLESLGKPWFCFGRSETIDEEVASKLARAGCKRIFLGIESMTQSRLDYFNKGTTVEQNRRAVLALDSFGIGAIAGFILGCPEDTVESMIATYEEYLALPLLAVSTSILSPDPGTREFVRAKRRGGDFLQLLSGPTLGCFKPNLELFGAGFPAGIPTLCRNVSKDELNMMTDVFEAHFIVREEIWEKFLLNLPSQHVGRLRAYFSYLLQRIEVKRRPSELPEVLDLQREVLSRPFAKMMRQYAEAL